MRKYQVLFLASAIIGVVISNGCATPYPKSRGLTIKKRLVSHHPGYPTTLQIQWLGAASYSIQLGDVSILTDPFFTRHSALRVLLGTVESDPETVRNKLCKIPLAQAVFVGHSHYDHILDLASTLEYWDDPAVRVYGSKTTCNILAGFSSNRANGQWRPTDTSPGWHDVVSGIDYQAVCAEHAPNLDMLWRRPALCPRGRPHAYEETTTQGRSVQSRRDLRVYLQINQQLQRSTELRRPYVHGVFRERRDECAARVS